MSPSSPSSKSPRSLVAPEPLRWRSWPLVRGGWRGVGFILLPALVAGVTLASTARPDLAGLAAALVIGASWRFFVPITFEIGPAGVVQQVFGLRRRLAWRSLRRVEAGEQGVFLAQEDVPLATLRGVFVPWDGRRQEITEQLKHYLERIGVETGSISRQSTAPRSSGK